MYFYRALKITLMTLISIVSLSVTYARTIIDPVINFNSGKPFAGDSIEASVSDWESYRPVLENAVLVMIKNPHSRYKVIGGTDNQECTGNGCKALSLRRAQCVYDWLLAHGANVEQLAAPEGDGDISINDNNTELGRSLNRRAEIDWISNEPLR